MVLQCQWWTSTVRDLYQHMCFCSEAASNWVGCLACGSSSTFAAERLFEAACLHKSRDTLTSHVICQSPLHIITRQLDSLVYTQKIETALGVSRKVVKLELDIVDIQQTW